MTIKLAVAGPSGRMGKCISDLVVNTDALELAVQISSSDSDKFTSIQQAYTHDFDVLIDFTNPKLTPVYLELCREKNIPIVIGTTGMSSDEFSQVQEAASAIPIVYAANTSVGINYCSILLKKLTNLIDSPTQVDIIESHHKHKIDAPSGTANYLGGILRENSKLGPINFHSIRAGEVVGEHTVTLTLESGERLTIAHQATSRTNFAVGAIQAAKWLLSQSAGLYSMEDVLK